MILYATKLSWRCILFAAQSLSFASRVFDSSFDSRTWCRRVVQSSISMPDVPWMLQVCSRNLDAAFKAVESTRIVLSARCWPQHLEQLVSQRLTISIRGSSLPQEFLSGSIGWCWHEAELPSSWRLQRQGINRINMWQYLADPVPVCLGPGTTPAPEVEVDTDPVTRTFGVSESRQMWTRSNTKKGVSNSPRDSVKRKFRQVKSIVNCSCRNCRYTMVYGHATFWNSRCVNVNKEESFPFCSKRGTRRH